VTILTFPDHAVYSANIGLLRARTQALDDFAIAATFEITARAIIRGDAAHFPAQRGSRLGTFASAASRGAQPEHREY
jgi:hypothetical protein